MNGIEEQWPFNYLPADIDKILHGSHLLRTGLTLILTLRYNLFPIIYAALVTGPRKIKTITRVHQGSHT